MVNPFTMKTAGSNIMPGEWEAQQRDIDAQRQYANALMQQSMESAPQGSMVSGVYVAPSWTQNLAHALKGWQAKTARQDADAQEKDLGKQMQQDLYNWINTKPTDKPALTTQPDFDESGAAIPQRTIPAVPATEQERMAWALKGLSNPLSSPLAAQEYQRMSNMAQLRELLGSAAGGASGQGGGVGGIPGVNPTAMALTMSGIPGGEKLGGMIQEAFKPVASREGDVLERDPVTGKLKSAYQQPKVEAGMMPIRDANGQVIGSQPIPDYAGGAASIKGAEAGAIEGARAGYDMVTINTPNGPMMVTRSQAAKMAGAAGMSPEDQQAIGAFANRDKSKPFNMSANPGGGIPLQGESGKKFEEGQGKFFSDTYADLQKGAMTANRTVANLSRMSQLIEGMNTGKLAPTGAQISALGDSLGIKIDPKLGSKQALEALSNEMALELRNPSSGAGMPGAMSDQDREYLKSMVPGLSRTPEGNKLMIDAAMKMAKRDQEVAQIARQYVAKNGQLDNGFYQELQDFSNANPLFQASGDIHSQAQAILRGGK